MTQRAQDDAERNAPGDPAWEGREAQLQALLDSAHCLIFMKDLDYRYLILNKGFERYGHTKIGDMLGRTDHELRPVEVADQLRVDEARVLSTREASEYEEKVTTPIGPKYFRTTKFPVYDADGTLRGVGGFITDITDQKRLEADRLERQKQVIAAQQNALRELSTPLLPISAGVLAIPLIGAIDSARAQEILETLLQGITAHSAHTAILDVTGIRGMNAEVANALMNAARAARLLGARVLLTGVSPEVARILVQIDADLGDITTLGTLASGIALALER